jgi:hypothetical protein
MNHCLMYEECKTFIWYEVFHMKSNNWESILYFDYYFITKFSYRIASAQDDWTQTVVSIETEKWDFKTLLSELNATNLKVTLNGEGTFTFFAPKMKPLQLHQMGQLKLSWKAQVHWRKFFFVMLRAEANGKRCWQGGQYNDSWRAETACQDQRAWSVVGNAKIIKTEVNASNGVIHAINAVSIPPEDPMRIINIIVWPFPEVISNNLQAELYLSRELREERLHSLHCFWAPFTEHDWLMGPAIWVGIRKW